MSKLKHLMPKAAMERINNNPDLFFVDVRCEAENKFVGRPLDCILVPWLDDPDWEPDPEKFVAAVKRSIGERDDLLNVELILICRSGYRSTFAGKCLIEFGFSNVAHVASGFEGDLDENDQRGLLNGWRHDGMPWAQC